MVHTTRYILTVLGILLIGFSLTLMSFPVMRYSSNYNHQVLGVSVTNLSSSLQSNVGLLDIQVSKKPLLVGSLEVPMIGAESAIVVDRWSQAILYEKDSDKIHRPASATKITTAIVAIERTDLLAEVVIPENLFKYVNGQTDSLMGIEPGDKFRRIDLLWGALLSSGNDAAYGLAATFDGGEGAFVVEMNRLAERLHLGNTKYTNPVGYDWLGHYTTAHDLSTLAGYGLRYGSFREIVGTRTQVVQNRNTDVKSYNLENTNLLLGRVDGVQGIKTGWTELAKGVLVTVVNRDGDEILVTVMGSNERERDTEKLIEWVYANYDW